MIQTLLLFLPETAVLGLATACLCLTLSDRNTVVKWFSTVLLACAFVAAIAAAVALQAEGSLFSGTYRIDLFSQAVKALIAMALVFTAFFSENSVSLPRERGAEYAFFTLTATLGMMMMPSAVDLLTLYVAIELSSYSLYLLAAFRQDGRNPEATVKYLLFGAAASGLMLWGFSLIAGVSGTTSLLVIAQNASSLAVQPAFAVGLLFSAFAFLFKLSGFPAHFWAPDVYESASTPVTNFIASASKAAAIAIFIRVFSLTGFPGRTAMALSAAAFVSMTLGNCAALLQKDVKRLLAYSSIAQAGYVVTGLIAGSFEGYTSALFYAFAYVLMNTGAFFVVISVGRAENEDNPQIRHFDGLAERSPFLALILLLSLLSLAGIPPLVGFTGKWILFSAAMERGHWFLVLWGVLNSVVSLFYYLTLVKHAYLEKPKVGGPITLPIHWHVLGFVLLAAIVFFGVFPNGLITFCQAAVAAAMPR